MVYSLPESAMLTTPDCKAVDAPFSFTKEYEGEASIVIASEVDDTVYTPS